MSEKHVKILSAGRYWAIHRLREKDPIGEGQRTYFRRKTKGLGSRKLKGTRLLFREAGRSPCINSFLEAWGQEQLKRGGKDH